MKLKFIEASQAENMATVPVVNQNHTMNDVERGAAAGS